MSYGHSEHDEPLIHGEPVAHEVLILPILIFGAPIATRVPSLDRETEKPEIIGRLAVDVVAKLSPSTATVLIDPHVACVSAVASLSAPIATRVPSLDRETE